MRGINRRDALAGTAAVAGTTAIASPCAAITAQDDAELVELGRAIGAQAALALVADKKMSVAYDASDVELERLKPQVWSDKDTWQAAMEESRTKHGAYSSYDEFWECRKQLQRQLKRMTKMTCRSIDGVAAKIGASLVMIHYDDLVSSTFELPKHQKRLLKSVARDLKNIQGEVPS